ncbi:MAG: hypothetical protein JWO06_1650, partial [Bacteroidota bacterium]|nr:hypothetical protein [Bacteroidota bacterium]
NPNNKVTVTTYGTTGMVLQNFGPPTTYIITTDFVTPTSEQTFHDSIVIGSNTQHIIQPHDTTNSGIYILVDTGMQGHYEDTIFINRTVNDINRINAPNITAWPVPGTNQLFMSGPKGMVSYSIFDVMGRVAATGEMDFGNGLVQKFDIVDLPPGFFIIQGTGKEGNWNYAFVKE